MTLDDRITRLTPHVLSIVRIVVGLLFLEHGLSKLFGFPNGTVREMFTLSWYSGVIEFSAGALLTLGLATRAAAFLASGEMAFAYFLGHAPKAFFHSSTAATRRFCIASSSFISCLPAPGRGAWTPYCAPPPARRGQTAGRRAQGLAPAFAGATAGGIIPPDCGARDA